jgi:hypothetical protein
MSILLTPFIDPLFIARPVWFQSFILLEGIAQLPFFFYATYALIHRDNSMRIPSIIYCTHVATTVWAILAEFLFSETITSTQRFCLLSFYSPYFVIPFIMAVYMALHPVPFPAKTKNT